jgi:hypothetical protein
LPLVSTVLLPALGVFPPVRHNRSLNAVVLGRRRRTARVDHFDHARRQTPSKVVKARTGALLLREQIELVCYGAAVAAGLLILASVVR